jgi:dipeptidyl aminopeptidase/acylaminoacyl peptidase
MAYRILCIALVVCVSAVGQAPIKKLALDMYFDMEQVSDPQISPDGKQIVYGRSWVDRVNDRSVSSLCIMNADGARNRRLTQGSQPRWSPDGTRIVFTREGEPRGTQIWVRWMDAEGAETQITHLDKSPGGVMWSPDGNSLAFSMLVPKTERWNIRLPARPEGARWTRDPRIIERVHYRSDRQGFLEEGYRHIFTVPATGGTPRQITSGNYNHGGGGGPFGGAGIDWTPDGKEILFSGLRTDDWEYAWKESEVYAVNVQTKAIRQLTTRKGPDGSPKVSPDGKLVAYTGLDWNDDFYTQPMLYVMNIDGSSPRVLTPNLDRAPQGHEWVPDGSGLYFGVGDKGAQNLYFASLRGEVRQVTTGDHMLNVTSLNANGQAAGVMGSRHRPNDVVSFSLRDPKPKYLTAVNEDVLGDVKLGEVEEIWYDSVDMAEIGGQKIHGWIIKPPDFDPSKKYPLMLSIHGGPHAMYNSAFNFAWQEHAANGYVILYTNPRGSTGYGYKFANAIKNAYPGKDFDDLMKGVDTVVAKGYIDTRNMFVYGCSGGGVLTAWTVGHTDRFAAASSNCPVTNWLSFVGTTDGAGWYRNFQKMPWEDPSEHLRRSPLMYVGNVKTPTMLMTGELDLRTPIPQTEEFYQALKMRKVPTAMVRFADEFHGTSSKPSNFLRTQLYLRYWFDKFTTKDKKEPAKSDSSGNAARE